MAEDVSPISDAAHADTQRPAGDEASGISDQAPRPRPWSRVVAVVALAAGVAVMIPAVGHSLRTTSSLSAASSVKSWGGDYVFLTCLRHALSTEVPRDAEVYAEPPNSYQEQELVEAAVGWAVPVSHPTPTSISLHLVNGPGGCSGMRVQARPPR